MTLIQWTARLSVGIPEIDHEHRLLIDILNLLDAQIAAGGDHQAIAALVEDIERHTELHFATEERLMDAHGYADADAHKAEHRSMLDDIHRYCDECVLRAGNPKVVLGYLEHWLLRHIENADRQLGIGLGGIPA